MSTSDVHPDEMPSTDPLADPTLSSFLDDLEAVVTRPAPQARPGLAAFFDGISPDVPLVDSPAPTAPRRTRRRKMTVAELLGALVAKLAGLGMAAKAGLGLGMAAASVTTAGVANVLPDPAQHAVATVVNAVAPFDITDPQEQLEDVVGDLPGDVVGDLPGDLPGIPEVTIPDAGDGEGDGTGTDGAPLNHGACVSAVARDKSTQGTPGGHGRAVSEAARSDCGKQTAGSPTTTVPSTTTTLGPTTTTRPELGTSSNRGPGNGNGNGNGGQGGANAGRGNGNPGNGNPGNGNPGNGNGNPGRR